MGSKKEWREQLRAARMARPETEWRAESAAVCARLASHETIRDATRIHVFWPIHQKREVDLAPLIRRWVDEGREVWLPVMAPGGLAAGRLLADGLTPGPFGTLQPPPDDAFDAKRLDVVVVPALAVDRSGIRLGYGGGWYDRFLATVHIPTVCPIFHAEWVSELPCDVHDIPVDHVVTSRASARTTPP